MRFSTPDRCAAPPVAIGPDGRPVEIFTYADGDADACRKVLGTALRTDHRRGKVAASDVVVLTPRSKTSSWLMDPSGARRSRRGRIGSCPSTGRKVGAADADEGQRGARRDDPRYKGLESPVVVLAEIDERVDEADLAALLYVGATRARSHLVVVCSDALRRDLLPSGANATPMAMIV